MADVRVRDVDEDVVFALRAQARRRGKSLSGELRDLLTEAALQPRRELVARLKDHQERMRAKHGVLADSTPGIRAERDGLE